MSTENHNLEQMLLSLPCHFTWKELNLGNARTVEMNIDNFEEHIQQTIQGTEVESFNLMGFYKTQQKYFPEARENFNKALECTNTEDEKIVTLACLAWLKWKEQTSDSSFDDGMLAKIVKVNSIVGERNAEDIPEVMAEKAFSIANSGFTEKGFKEALVSIDRAMNTLLERPDKSVTLKFTKVSIMQQLHQARKKERDKDCKTDKEIRKLWEEVIQELREYPRRGTVYGQALIQYALFLAKIDLRDNGATGKRYAEEAERVASSSQAVMRNVAKFYIRTSKMNIDILDKAERILNKIVESKPTEAAAFKELLLLGQLLLKKYKLASYEIAFVNAEECLRNAWNGGKKYVGAAMDLVHLYKAKYDKVGDVSALVEAENIFFVGMFSNFENYDTAFKAYIYSMYAGFIQEYGSKLASYHQTTFYWEDGDIETIDKIEEVLQLLNKYREDRDNDKLLKVEQIFKDMYRNLKQLKDPVKARFHQEYGAFLNKYSSDLAFRYLVKSLEHNPHQRRKYVHEPLKELAQKKIASSDKEEQMQGHKTLQWMGQLNEKESCSDYDN